MKFKVLAAVLLLSACSDGAKLTPEIKSVLFQGEANCKVYGGLKYVHVYTNSSGTIIYRKSLEITCKDGTQIYTKATNVSNN